MLTRQSVRMTIFITKTSSDRLKKLVVSLDNTSGPLGSGGYSVRRHEELDNFFIFTECDCAPARSFIVGIKEKEIWAVDLAGYLAAALVNVGIEFDATYRNFPSKELARKAFQSKKS